MNNILISVSALALVTTVAVACTAPTTPESSEAPVKSTPKAAASDSSTAPSSAPTGASAPSAPATSTTPSTAPTGASSSTAPQGGDLTPAQEAAAEACFTQCSASTPSLQPILAADDACASKCGDQDKACFDNCDKLLDQACQTNEAACKTLDDCNQKCFPADPQGGGAPPGGN
jgi:hypothetical protein